MSVKHQMYKYLLRVVFHIHFGLRVKYDVNISLFVKLFLDIKNTQSEILYGSFHGTCRFNPPPPPLTPRKLKTKKKIVNIEYRNYTCKSSITLLLCDG